MLPEPAQFLLRLDDLCPTMRPDRWQPFDHLIRRYSLRPVLAVVPDNQDHHLEVAPADSDFWEKMRALQDEGATIALHGYQHRCIQPGRGMIPLYRHTEFAGVPRAIQQQWIRSGLSILRSHDLNPRVFVAPRHGFDRGTLWALRKEGVEVLSDGAGRVAHRRNGLIWIPQQLWAPVDHKCGLWTICLHPNTTGERALRKLEEFLKLHAEQFTSVDRVLKEMRPGIRSPQETAYAAVQMSRLLLSRRLRRLLHSRLLR